eukprot:jgi/Ulvmu1/7093/UM033_0154.1
MLAAVARRGRSALSSLATPAGDCLDQLAPCMLRGNSRAFTASCSRHGHSAASGVRFRDAAQLNPALAQCSQQVRHFSWAFWRTSQTAPSSEELEPEAPEIDLAAVDTIVDMAGPATMDAATWGMIHSTAWPHTYAAELALATVHDSLGMSWIAAIPATVVLMRTAMAPFFILSQATAFKMSKAAPMVQDAQRQMMLSIERGVPFKEAQEEYTEMTKQIMKDNKTGPMHMVYPILVQMPVVTGYYFALSAMCNNHLPSMVVDAAPYGFDLTAVDPLHLLNVSVPASLMAAGYLGMSNKWHTLPEAQKQVAKYAIIGAPFIMTAMFWSFPAALCYYWTCSNLYSIVFELVFRHPGLRAAVGLPSIAEQTELALAQQKRQAAGGSGGGFSDIMEMYSKGAAATQKQLDAQSAAPPPAAAAGGAAAAAATAAGGPNRPMAAGSAALRRASRKGRR